MRIGVIGAGAVGGTIAALLDRAGHLVEVTARGEHLDAIRRDGLRLSGAWGEHVAHPEASELLRVAPDLVFLCTKAQDAAAAIRENQHLLAGRTVVVVQNGLNGLRQAMLLLPESDCVGALVLYASSYLSPGAVTVTTAANTYLGAGDGDAPEAAVFAAGVLNAAMPAFAVPNFTGSQWTKLIVNQINAMPAITGLSAQDSIGDRRLRRILTASMREAVRVGFDAEVHYGSIQGLSNAILRFVALSPVRVAQIVPLMMRRRMGQTPNPGSTLQSIRRGQLTEIDYLNGAVVGEARELGRDAPINARLVELVHEVERTRSFLAPDTVVERMRGVR